MKNTEVDAENPSDSIHSLVKIDSRTKEHKARDRLLLALSMFEDGVEMKKMKLIRYSPDLSPEDIEEKLSEWLRNRHAPTLGDAREWPLEESPGD